MKLETFYPYLIVTIDVIKVQGVILHVLGGSILGCGKWIFIIYRMQFSFFSKIKECGL